MAWSIAVPGVAQQRRTPVVEAVEAVAPAVVSITTEVPSNNPFAMFYGRSTSRSQGSGVVIQPNGIVLTNAHVVEGSSRIHATFANGDRHEADVLGIAQELDLAVLRLREVSGALTAVPLASSADLMLGEPVIAIGNPFGLGHTVTTGVISAINRTLETEQRVYQDFIQTDASINPGNSGGPLLNIRGELIGINTAIRPDAEGIGFAIPSDRAVKVARDLLAFGSVRIPWLGVDLTDVSIRASGKHQRAARIVFVHQGTKAHKAGLLVGDLLVTIDDRPVNGRSDLNAYLAGFDPGRSVALGLLRAGQLRRVSLNTSPVPEAVVDHTLRQVLGIQVERQNAALVVTDLRAGGSFAQAGLQPGDRILRFNGQPVSSVSELRREISRAKNRHWPSALLTIQRGNARGQITLTI